MGKPSRKGDKQVYYAMQAFMQAVGLFEFYLK